MNPHSNHMIGKATHREYEAKYGHSYRGEKTAEESFSPAIPQKLALALGGLSVLGTIVALTLWG